MCSIASICGADGRLNVDSVCTVHCVSGDAWNVDEFLRFLTDASPATIKAYRQDLNDFIRWSEEGGYRTPKAIPGSIKVLASGGLPVNLVGVPIGTTGTVTFDLPVDPGAFDGAWLELDAEDVDEPPVIRLVKFDQVLRLATSHAA